MAFPDEDVVIGSRFVTAGGLEAFDKLDDVTPSPGTRAVGEERAWGRRLAKRFGIENGAYDDRSFLAKGDGTFPLALDHEALKPEKVDQGYAPFFDDCDEARGDSLIAFGWAMAEDLAKLS